MKTNKSLLLFALIICTSNIAFVPKAQAEEVTKTKIESNLNKDYPYTVTDSLKNLDKAKSSIEKLANSKRWSSVPENLLMVYLWNKDTYHDDIVLKLADEWIVLAKNVNDPDYVEDAK
ncbi:MAG: hypothetical protein H7263_18345, partial [Candidatus Sericytochromatia bacterium]|nr:hypothetical protein [Candidatus Sericytochromatia bacterium]